MDNTIELLRKAKKESGMTLKEVADASGISLGTVNKLFSGGINSVKTETAEKLGKALGINLSRLIEYKEHRAEMPFNSYGFIKCGAYTNEVKVGDVEYNVNTTIELIKKANRSGVLLAVFPELNLTSYTSGDLVYQNILLNSALDGLQQVIESTRGRDMLVFVGLPVRVEGRIYNCAAAVCKGRLLAVIPKRNLPNYNEFYEKRYFAPAPDKVFNITLCGFTVPFGYKIVFTNTIIPEMKVACELCEDIWVPDSPSVSHSYAGANIIVNLSSSNETAGKYRYRRQMVSMQSSKCLCGYVYADSGFGESTSDTVFAGHNLIYEAGRKLDESNLFGDGIAVSDIDCSFLEFERSKKFPSKPIPEDYTYVKFEVGTSNFKLQRRFSKTPFIPSDKPSLNDRCDNILQIQSHALLKRIKHVNPNKLVLGISGGLDSTLAMLVCVRALALADKKPGDLVAISMPCFGTTSRTRNNAKLLSQALGVTFKEIDISQSVLKHFEDIEQNPNVNDVTFENSQARERTQVLMDYACKIGGFVIGTGDLSESALGWATYNGDHMSMYNVNATVPKTLAKCLVRYEADKCGGQVKEILLDIIDTPISPELIPSENDKITQPTEAIVGPYILNDFFLYYFVKHGFAPSKVYYIAKHTFLGDYKKEEIAKWLELFIKRFFKAQFKRSCCPDGIKSGALGLSPRGDWRMPSDASYSLWLEDLKTAVQEDIKKD